tara:strand:- start:152 stop:418 length:267 start_codon:yes stop_codon:yes gene_type:complete
MTILITNKENVQDRLVHLSHVVALDNGDGSYDLLKDRFGSTRHHHFETQNDLNNYIQELTADENHFEVENNLENDLNNYIQGVIDEKG